MKQTTIYTNEEKEEFTELIAVLKQLNETQQFGVKLIITGITLTEAEKEKRQRKLCRKS